MTRRVAVIGAGAAGLTAALHAAQGGAGVVLLNAHPKIGLKILMSGGTRCNVTHREVSERDYNGGSRPFVARILRAFTPEQTREWFESMGVALKLEDTGKYFPEADDAQVVLDALLRAVAGAGVAVSVGARVIRLERGRVAGESSGFRLGIQHVRDSAAFSPAVSGYGREIWPLISAEPDEWLEADAVIVATGGLSFPRTGSDGVGYSLLSALGHTLAPPIPALTPLMSEDRLCRLAQGVTVEAELSLWVDRRRSLALRGSLLIAHFGYSGPVALDLSRHWLRAEGSERRVTASFLPGESRESLVRALAEAQGSSVRRVFAGRLPERLVDELAGEASVDPSALVGQVSRERRSALIGCLIERDLHVTGTLGYEKAEVTAGGVRLGEVNPSTLESRIVPGLFLCGEVLDVEGRLGGFNFQWAWSSGTLAGRAVAGLSQGKQDAG